jgi:hypothetical protein
MRMFLVVLAACGAPGATPAPAPLAGRSAGRGEPVESAISARLAGEPSGEAIDIEVDGTTAVSMDACQRLLSRFRGRVIRACAARPLPSALRHGVTLVTIEHGNEHAFEVRVQTAGLEPPRLTTTTTTYEPIADVSTCEATRAQRASDEQRGRVEAQRAQAADTERRLSAAIMQQATVCSEADATVKQCEAQSDDLRKQCLLDAQVRVIECDVLTRDRNFLELQRSANPSLSTAERRCATLY